LRLVQLRDRRLRLAGRDDIRASTDEQTLGPEAQRAALALYCERHALTLVAVHADLGVSGAAPLDKRPGMVSALAALAEFGAGVLLVAKRDRLARDVMSVAVIEKAASNSGARVVSAAGEGTDSEDADDPTAQLMRRIIDAFAEYERLVIKARTKAALAVKRARGQRTGKLPFGSGVADDGKTLVTDPAEQRAMEEVRALRASGLSCRKIVARLNAEGVACRGARWHLTTVSMICHLQAA